MSYYPIQRWDAVISGNNLTQVPMIYIEPDTTFLEFVKRNEYSVICKITGSGNTIYDGRLIQGFVNKSAEVPNCRPNFYAATGLYTITLVTGFQEYPPASGMVQFFGIK